MIRETLEGGSQHAFVAITPDHGVSFQRRPVAGQASANTDASGIVTPYWLKLTRTGNVFAAQTSADGATWADIVVSPALEITMAGNVYIGLAVTSHDAAISTVAQFSNISTTGTVSGQWQTAGIGATHPQGNTPQPLNVAVEDADGSIAVAANPDTAANRPTRLAAMANPLQRLWRRESEQGRNDDDRRRRPQQPCCRRDGPDLRR